MVAAMSLFGCWARLGRLTDAEDIEHEELA